MESNADWKFLLTGLAATVGMELAQSYCAMQSEHRRLPWVKRLLQDGQSLGSTGENVSSSRSAGGSRRGPPSRAPQAYLAPRRRSRSDASTAPSSRAFSYHLRASSMFGCRPTTLILASSSGSYVAASATAL